MAKAVKKKKSRRLKRSVRKTLGALFMASSIAVAAIPTQGLQAAVAEDRPMKVTLGFSNSSAKYKDSIPIADAGTTIYSTGDGMFQFAYLSNGSSTTDSAMIMKFNKNGEVPGNELEIPDTVEAYAKYSAESSAGIYVAVDNKGEFLYYLDYVPVMENGKPVYETDEEGNQIIGADGLPVQKMEPKFQPCYFSAKSIWGDLSSSDFYYYDESSTNYVSIGDGSTGRYRIAAATVHYISNQTLVDNADKSGWDIVPITSPEEGVFAGASNIRTLKIGTNLSGIGAYAFYGCGALRSVEFGNGMRSIGNWAFANCTLLEEVNFASFTNFDIMGDHAFYNCRGLQFFMFPNAMTRVGDSAFENCDSMTAVDLIEADETELNGVMVGSSSLVELGYDVFKNCASLQSITFPRTYAEDLDVTMFQGCTNLQFIEDQGGKINLVATQDPDYKFTQFKEEHLSTFYLKGIQNSDLHETATSNEIPFSFFDRSVTPGRYVYELTVRDSENRRAVYRVTSDNELVYCDIDQKMDTVELPATIGPYGIQAIDEYTFNHKCFLETIVIPASVKTIEQNAFSGCHRLENVIFTDPANMDPIGAGAFKTQITDGYHLQGCSDADVEQIPTLNFVGPIGYDYAPFQYAMDPNERINYGAQPETHIKYYSGWPTNLVVQYDPETDKNTLVDYPTLKDIRYGEYTTDKYVYMTLDYEKAARKAVAKYLGIYNAENYPEDFAEDPSTMISDYEWEIINAALDIVLPAGIEAIGTAPDGSGLFEYNESNNELETKDLNGKVLSKSITAKSLQEVNARAFAGAIYLTSITLEGTTFIGDYAFEGCEKLSDVSISESISKMGLRPFTGCDELSYVDFNGSERFACDNSVIFEYADGGKNLVEYLCGVSSSLDAEDLAGVTYIYPEAFMGTYVTRVDLSQSSIENVPASAFEGTLDLFSVILPNTCLSISEDAFTDSSIRELTIPGSVTYIDPINFRDTDNDGKTNLASLTIFAPEKSAGWTFATQNNINWKEFKEPVNYTVSFYDDIQHILEPDHFIVELEVEEYSDAGAAYIKEGYSLPTKDGYIFDKWSTPINSVTQNVAVGAMFTELEVEPVIITFYDWEDTETKKYVEIDKLEISAGESVRPPKDPSHDGYFFTGWLNAVVDENKSGYLGPYYDNTDLFAQFEKIDSSDTRHLVRFYDWDGTLLAYSMVEHGGNAKLPEDPYREGYTFERWVPSPTSVIENMDVTARYRANGSTGDDGSGGTGDDGTGGDGSGGGTGGDGTGSGGDGSGSGGTSTFYTLTVKNGSGSGSYVAGSQPIIIANDPSSTQEFSHWTIDPADTTIASKVLSATVITMPEGNVTVTAHYKAKTGSSTGSGNSSSANSSRPNNSGGTVGGTTVVIDKNGLSNTGVVSATVNGSSDNFTIKVTESSSATEAVVRALMTEYGSLDNIKYFPMDISLYDSTGTKKITDTTGLSVSITLPLPDSLITYAGNNKVAGVVNDKLDKLSAKFTTIQGVSCVTFTAEHFSPYVIYVDTAHLSAGTSSDSTPQTGDGIHPKWFLSIGLACLSFVMFMQKDRRKPKKVKVKAKA